MLKKVEKIPNLLSNISNKAIYMLHWLLNNINII